MTRLRTTLAAAMAACLLLPGATARGGSPDGPDLFVNDDGAQCTIMIDFGSGDPDPLADAGARAFVGRLLRAVPPAGCAPGSTPILMTIHVGALDSYGQPRWDSVSFLAEYRIDGERLGRLLAAGAADGDLAAALVRTKP